ncbi:serine/threonine-protein kinase-like protein At1g28390 [Actinidia eriantha]|uniref:serine/threonine-protein kinase-like protein At1g28390 n=1 Tax=Actinidia eriantha TaxID=165200 RepID=UPI0025871307|nr:serine/threonine-protein kinase-like protein At1g28390 [Actinidia eriantha]
MSFAALSFPNFLSLSLSLTSCLRPFQQHLSLTSSKICIHMVYSIMGFLSCNAESSIATCDPYNWELTRTRKLKHNSNKPNNKHFEIREFAYSDLKSATDSFAAESFLGKGSHGSVYRASLDGGKLVAAVKRTTTATTPDTENEIDILSRVRSPRVVNLLGFSVDLNERKLIVVEFMPNGSLYDLLHKSNKPPGWGRRVRFALQVARAVQHLHASNPPVIHRDIKSSNVLIDGDGNARLGDFGLALTGHVEDVRVKCTPPAGTLGYLDPGYLAPGDLSAKSDVFSFGILLLELISGRNAIDMSYSPPSVVDWAAPLIKGGDYAAICDPRIAPPQDPETMRLLAVLAARCVRSTAEKRPAASEIVDYLRSVKQIMSSPIWNHLRRQAIKPSKAIKYEPLDDATEIIKTSRVGSRRNRKVSSVPSADSSNQAIGSSDKYQVARSKSVGSSREIKSGLLDSNFIVHSMRRAGLAVKMPTVRLSKSRSMGMLQSTRLVVRNPYVGELEESKLLVNLEKRGTQ